MCGCPSTSRLNGLDCFVWDFFEWHTKLRQNRPAAVLTNGGASTKVNTKRLTSCPAVQTPAGRRRHTQRSHAKFALLLARVWGGLPWVSASPSGLVRFALGICFSLGFGAVCGAKCFKTRVLGHAALASDFFAGILHFLLLARVWGGLPWVSASPSGLGRFALGICFSLAFGAVCGAKCFKTRVLGHAALASDFFAGILLFLLLARVWGGLPWVSASPSGLGRFALGYLLLPRVWGGLRREVL